MTPRAKLVAVATVLVRWMLFGLLISLTPLAASELIAWGRSDWIPYVELVGGGELLLLSVGLVAASVGELFGRDATSYRSARMVIAGLGLALLTLAALWFADVSGAVRDGESIDASAVALGSTIMFSFAVILGASAILVSEVSRWS